MSILSDQDKVLADRVVAHGVGRRNKHHSGHYDIGESVILGKFFVRSWLVAGAMLQLCLDKEIVPALIMDEAMRNLGESFPRAVNEAAVEALDRV